MIINLVWVSVKIAYSASSFSVHIKTLLKQRVVSCNLLQEKPAEEQVAEGDGETGDADAGGDGDEQQAEEDAGDDE